MFTPTTPTTPTEDAVLTTRAVLLDGLADGWSADELLGFVAFSTAHPTSAVVNVGWARVVDSVTLQQHVAEYLSEDAG